MPSVARAGRHSGSTIREEDPQLAGAVDAGRLEQLVRDGQHELPHQEHAERRGQERQDQPGVGVDQAEVADQHEQRHERDHAGHHQRAQHHQEQRLLPGKSSFARA